MKSNWLNLSARVGLPVAGLALQASVAWAQVGPELCGPLFVPPSAPPWDFNVDKFFLPVVVDNHFTAPVEALIRGQTNRIVGPDIDYTLRRFPNHPRALNAAVRLSERDQTKVENSLPLPVECYFERALRFRPKDAVPRMMYAQWLAKRKRTEEAIKNLEFVAENNAEDSCGLLELETDAQPLPDGQPVRFEVIGDSRTSQRWFGIYHLPGAN